MSWNSKVSLDRNRIMVLRSLGLEYTVIARRMGVSVNLVRQTALHESSEPLKRGQKCAALSSERSRQ